MAKSKSRQITKAQAAALLKMTSNKKSAPMDAEDKIDHGADEASENDSGKLKFGSPEWRAKYGRGKSKTVADALSVGGK